MAVSKHLLKWLSIFFLVLLLSVVTPTPALAFDSRSGNNVTIGSGEVIESDLYLFGTNITVDGTVNGDVFAFGQYITVNGTINGGFTTAGQVIIINGKISRGVRAAGQTVTVSGNIERDLVAAGNIVNVSKSARIVGDLVLGAQTASVDGGIGGNIKAATGKVTLNDGVGGDADLRSSEIIIASAADVKGNLTYTSENDASIQSGAKIGGTTSHEQPEPSGSPRNLFIAGVVGSIVFRVLAFLWLFIIGIILIIAIPRQLRRLAASLRTSPVSSLGWGALLFFVTPLAALIVMITVIGLPIGIISLLIWGIAVYLSDIPVALIIGWLILSRQGGLESKGIMIGALALGLFILSLLTAIPIVGWIVWLFIAIFGLGTLISSWGRVSITRK